MLLKKLIGKLLGIFILAIPLIALIVIITANSVTYTGTNNLYVSGGVAVFGQGTIVTNIDYMIGGVPTGTITYFGSASTALIAFILIIAFYVIQIINLLTARINSSALVKARLILGGVNVLLFLLAGIFILTAKGSLADANGWTYKGAWSLSGGYIFAGIIMLALALFRGVGYIRAMIFYFKHR